MLLQHVHFNPKKAIRALYPNIANPGARTPLLEFLGLCLSDLDEFIPVFLDSDFEKHLEDLKRKNPPPVVEYAFDNDGNSHLYYQMMSYRQTSSGFIGDQFKDAQRSVEEHPLNQEEFGKAGNYLTKQKLLLDSIAAFQLCLAGYFEALAERLANQNKINLWKVVQYVDSSDFRKARQFSAFEARIGVMMLETQRYSFMRDLAPVMAYSLVERGSDIGERALAQSLVDAFRMSAFKSEKARCPFAEYITEIANRDYQRGEDGRYFLQERSRPGAFIMMLMRHLEQSERYALLREEDTPELVA